MSCADSAASERLRLEGRNELPTAKPKTMFAIAAEVLGEPMFLLLIARGAVYLVLGSIEEAIALGASIFRARNLFQFSFLHFNDVATCTLLALTSVTWFEAAKVFRRSA